MKKIALLAILAAFVAAMGIAAAVDPSQGETEATCGVTEILSIDAPDSADLGDLDPGDCGDAYEDATVESTVDWKLSVEDDSDWDGDGTEDGDGYMRDSDGHTLTAQFQVDVDGGAWEDLPPFGSPKEMTTGTPGQITVETSYHQCVEWGDYAGDYTIIVTWIVEPDI